MSRDWWKKNKINKAPKFTSHQFFNQVNYNENLNEVDPLTGNHQSRYFQIQTSVRRQQKYMPKRQSSIRSEEATSPKSRLPPCGHCRRGFDIAGRCPIVLDCEHTFCEDCIITSINNFKINCFECKQVSTGKDIFYKGQSIKSAFAVNHYLVGRIVHENHSLNMAKYTFCAPQPQPSLESIVASLTSDNNQCSQCSQEATLRCIHCFENYCSDCYNKVHAAKGLRNHETKKLESLTVVPCKKHVGCDLEIYCLDCDVACCHKCFLREHPKHEFRELTVLDEKDQTVFEELLAKCEKSLIELEKSAKKNKNITSKKIEQPDKATIEIEETINKYFSDLHSQLQVLESDLISRVRQSQHYKSEDVVTVTQQLNSNLKIMREVVSNSRNILNPQFNAKFNVRVVMEQLEYASQLPTCLVCKDDESDIKMEFKSVDVLKNLDKELTLNIENPRKYMLITKDEAEEDIDASIISDSSSISSVNLYNPSPDISFNTGPSDRSMNFTSPNLGNYVTPDIPRNNSSKSNNTEQRLNEEINLIKKAFHDLSHRLEFPINAQEKVIITHIDNLDNIYVHPKRLEKAIDKLHSEISNIVSRSDSFKLCGLQNNDAIYITKSYKNNKYDYIRCQIKELIGINNEDFFNVNYIDFGKTVHTKMEDLWVWEQTPNLAEVPPIAYHCKIINIQPKDNDGDNRALNLSNEILDGNLLMLVYQSDGPFEKMDVDFITVFEDDMYSLRDSLIFAGSAVSTQKDLELNLFVIKKSIKHSFINENYSSFPNCVDVCLSSYNTYDDFYVQKVDNLEKFEILKEQLNEYLKTSESHIVYAPYINMIVAVKHTDIHSDKKTLSWQRAVVTEVIYGLRLVKVFLVDTGDTITVDGLEIRKLPTTFLSLESQAIHVKLDESAQDFFQEHEIKFPSYFSMKITDHKNPMTVILSNTSSNTKPLSKVINIENIKVVADTVFQKRSTIEFVKVQVLLFKDPSCLYVHFIENKDFMSKLRKSQIHLQHYNSQNQLKTKNEWNVGDLCIAYDNIKRQHYRGIIEKVIDPEHNYQIFNQDYAEIFNVGINEIGIMDDIFKGTPAFAYRCHFYGIEPSTTCWSQSTIDQINEIFEENDIYMSKIGTFQNKDRSAGVMLWYKLVLKPATALDNGCYRWCNLNYLLVENGVAFKTISMKEFDKLLARESEFHYVSNTTDQTTWLPPGPIAETKPIPAMVTFVDNETFIFFHLENEHESFIQMGLKIQTDIKAKKQFTENTSAWQVGDLCTAQYHGDDLWYRGEVVGVSDNNVEVFMIDYGNTENVKQGQIVKNVMFPNIPAFARKADLLLPDKSKANVDDIYNLIVESTEKITIKVEYVESNIPVVIVLVNDISIENLISQETSNAFTIKESLFDQQSDDDVIKATSVQIVDINNDDDVVVEENSLDIENKNTDEVVIEKTSEKIKEEVNDVLIETTSVKIREKTNDDIVDETTSKKTKEPHNYWSYVEEDLPIEPNFEIKVIDVLNYNTVLFYVCKHGFQSKFQDPDWIRGFDKLSADIAYRLNASRSLSPLSCFHRHALCLSKHSASDSWARAKIYDKGLDGSIQILFVDYGEIKTVHEDDLLTIKHKWTEFPINVYIAKLHNFYMINKEDQQKVFDFMKNSYCNVMKVCEIVSRNPLIVNIYDKDTHEISYKKILHS